MAGLRTLLEFGLFHGDPHPGNIFAMRDGRIAYVDFGNVAELSQRNKEVKRNYSTTINSSRIAKCSTAGRIVKISSGRTNFVDNIDNM